MMYLGKGYNGYQRQQTGKTIQGCIEDAMKVIYKENIEIVGCGRTDTGVNAKEYYFHFETSYQCPQDRIFSLNGILGDHIVIQSIQEAKRDFHARFDATLRAYEYRLHTKRNPFLKDSSFYLALGAKSLDISSMIEGSELLMKYNDFFTFCKAHSDANSMTCKIYKSEWDINGDKMIFHIEANRFLRGMVRMIVGAILNIGLGKMEIAELITALETKQRLSNSWSVPAHGLYLSKVEYV